MRLVASAARREREGAPSLVKMCERWALTVPGEINMRWPIWRLVRPAVMWHTTWSSVGVRLSQPCEWRIRARGPGAGPADVGDCLVGS